MIGDDFMNDINKAIQFTSSREVQKAIQLASSPSTQRALQISSSNQYQAILKAQLNYMKLIEKNEMLLQTISDKRIQSIISSIKKYNEPRHVESTNSQASIFSNIKPVFADYRPNIEDLLDELIPPVYDMFADFKESDNEAAECIKIVGEIFTLAKEAIVEENLQLPTFEQLDPESILITKPNFPILNETNIISENEVESEQYVTKEEFLKFREQVNEIIQNKKKSPGEFFVQLILQPTITSTISNLVQFFIQSIK
jgi:hypothetical protein